MKRILICGANGLLGQRLALMLSTQTEYEVLNTSHHRSFVFDDRLFDYTQLDISRKGDVKSLISSFQPTVIINAASATNVDWCEDHREEAWNANVVGVENLIDAARKVGARIIHLSTDYVFDGKQGPYGEDDRPNPISYYGKSKLAGENALRIADLPFAIVRTIVLYGSGLDVKQNFALWVLNSLKAGRHIRCVDDQISNPTYVSDLAYAVVKVFELTRQGVYHVCGGERISRYDFAVRIASIFDLDSSLIDRIKTSDLQQPAPRPLVTGFITLKAESELGFKPMDTTQGLTLLKRELQNARKN
ncbi:MAG TPA: dTDP-4-dehydrorhamnose reductase [Bacteroidetes bacterium]|nr:dTDP-4-dehydrorhamnose reductase [Bacteroidota bacterium]